MSFWTSFENYLNKAIKDAEAQILVIAHAIKPLVIASAEEVGQVALASVIAQAASVASGKEKLSAATANVLAAVSASGKSVLASTAEAAVQTAYNMISASLQKK